MWHILAGEQPSADGPSAPARKHVELRLRAAKPRRPKPITWSSTHPRVCASPRGSCRWKASRALVSLVLGGSTVEGVLASVKTYRLAGADTSPRQGMSAVASIRLARAQKACAGFDPNTRAASVLQRETTQAKAGVCGTKPPRHPGLEMPETAIQCRRGRFVARGHASRGPKQRRRSRRSKGVNPGPRNQNAPTTLVTEVGCRDR